MKVLYYTSIIIVVTLEMPIDIKIFIFFLLKLAKFYNSNSKHMLLLHILITYRNIFLNIPRYYCYFLYINMHLCLPIYFYSILFLILFYISIFLFHIFLSFEKHHLKNICCLRVVQRLFVQNTFISSSCLKDSFVEYT